MKNQIFPGVYSIEKKIFTENLVPGKRIYGERLLNFNKTELREWNPYRSKLGAGLKKGLNEMPIKKGSKVLYLGSAEGTTVSHISDIINFEGVVFGVEISHKTMRKFINLTEKRENIIPILGDANQPKKYKEYLEGIQIDVLFQDVAQPNQTEIFIKNADEFLKKGSSALLAIKARSIDVTQKPEAIFKKEIIELKKYFNIKQIIILDPFEKDHALIHCEKK